MAEFSLKEDRAVDSKNQISSKSESNIPKETQATGESGGITSEKSSPGSAERLSGNIDNKKDNAPANAELNKERSKTDEQKSSANEPIRGQEAQKEKAPDAQDRLKQLDQQAYTKPISQEDGKQGENTDAKLARLNDKVIEKNQDVDTVRQQISDAEKHRPGPEQKADHDNHISKLHEEHARVTKEAVDARRELQKAEMEKAQTKNESDASKATGESGGITSEKSSPGSAERFDVPHAEAPQVGEQVQAGETNEAENDQTTAECDLAKIEDDQAVKAEAESKAEAQAAIEAVGHPLEEQKDEPAQCEGYDTFDENAGDRVREQDKQPPVPGSEADISMAETNGDPPSYQEEMMGLEVSESRELCQRIGDSYKDYDQSDLERREDGSLFFKDYQVELTAQGDAFGSYKDLQRWIGDHGMAGPRQDGCPYLEAHHLIPAAECKDAGLDPDLAPCVAVQNDLHIAMLHGSDGLTNRPEFSSVERMRAYYEGFYDGLNAATWARRAGDYLQSHNVAFKTTLAERHAALAPVAPPTAEVADRKPEHKAPLTGVATPFGIDRPFLSSIKTGREVTEESGIGDEKAETDHSASARLDEGWKKMWSEHPSVEIRSRFETAYNFYKDNGVSDDRIISHLKGIDFHNEVKVLQGKAGDIVYSHLKDGKIGNYFSKADPKETLGIQPAPENIGPERPDCGRFERATEAFIATGPYAYLESTASWLHEWDDDRAGKIGVEIFEGGGRQLYIPDKSVFQPILPIQNPERTVKSEVDA